MALVCCHLRPLLHGSNDLAPVALGTLVLHFRMVVLMSYLAIKENEATCEDCVFFKYEDERAGQCRKSPPDRPFCETAQTVYVHRLVFLDDWCGEWKPKD